MAREQVEHKKELQSPEEFEREIRELIDDDDVSGVEHMLMHRDEHEKGKMPDEDKIWQWLQGRAENKLGRKPLVEFDQENAVIVPIDKPEK